jgi:radical SAM superfamily enzyme YgiQ (UPF0313 family)
MAACRIYLVDLTHDGMILSSNVFPLSVGLIGAYLKEQRGSQVEIELFKYPDDFSDALLKAQPDIVGFAHYSWNSGLSRAYAAQIKARWPNTIIVFGGPNYGLTEEEVKTFWKRSGSAIDFNVVKEGEEAFLRLFDVLVEHKMDVAAIKEARLPIGNVHYAVDGDVIMGPDLKRVDLADLPSPYLMGMMDKFFDENLCPLVHTTRGCPFSCAFCTEGAAYYNVVSQRVGPLEQELHYIASRVRGPRDLFISDANFGMFKQDYDKARILSDCQAKYDYPKYIHVSTGKNQKARVIEIVKSLNGAVSMAASLQSTDETVLANVARSNISIDQLAAAGKMANAVNTGTYSELILGLPGDSLRAHRNSLRDTVEMRFDNIRMYQLIMLPQTQLNTPDERRKYDVKTMFRIMPRSFGRYAIGEVEFIAVESEEILVGSSTLPFEDYVAAREMDLTVEILHNGRIYAEVVGVCDTYGLSWFDLIMRFYERRRDLTPEITEMYDAFMRGTTERLWPTEDALVDYVKDNLDAMLVDERGTNEMSSGKATAFFMLLEQINGVLFKLLKDRLREEGKLDDHVEHYLDELERYSLLRKRNLLTADENVVEQFSIDLERIESAGYQVQPQEVRLSGNRNFVVTHNDQQREYITQYLREFGNSFDGLGKMLMRYPHVHRLFRHAELAA